MKRLFLLLFASFMGIIGAPDFLMASDTVKVQKLDETMVVETVILPIETAETAKVLPTEAFYDTTDGAAAQPTVAMTPAIAPEAPAQTTTVVPANSIAIAGRALAIVDVADTSVDSGDHVNKYGSKFLYGHNSGAVFGGLLNMGVGNTFVVVYAGTATTYRVAKIVIFEKNTQTGQLQLNGSGNYMKSVANARSGGVQYDMALMTCYGTMYGNGDASHRWVIFANKV